MHCDSIGSWKVELCGRDLIFHAMTVIDACANLVKIAFAHSTTAKEGADAVENTWLPRCPSPVKIVTDQGPEFGQEFSDMCERLGVIHDSSASWNPQGNSLIKSIHKSIGLALRTVSAARNPQSKIEGEQCI